MKTAKIETTNLVTGEPMVIHLDNISAYLQYMINMDYIDGLDILEVVLDYIPEKILEQAFEKQINQIFFPEDGLQ